jgi:DNA-3-methyladenine glycosylase II
MTQMEMATRPVAHTFELTPRGPYSFVASREFLEGFAPAAYQGAGNPDNRDHLHLAFVADGGEDIAGVCLRGEGGWVVGEVFGAADPAAVTAQVARILSLDVDGSLFPEVGRRDPVVGRLQARYPGLRPVNFYSPYEAGAWAIISRRIRIVQAARVKDRMARELGPAVEVHGELLYAFPGPARLRELDGFQGLFGRKVEWLHALAAATMEGRLDAARLRALSAEQALAELRELPGIGAFASEHILLRGAGEPDYLPWREPRVPKAFAAAYGLPSIPTTEEMQGIADNWRPYRTWGAFLLRVMREEDTHEIAAIASSK